MVYLPTFILYFPYHPVNDPKNTWGTNAYNPWGRAPPRRAGSSKIGSAANGVGGRDLEVDFTVPPGSEQ